MDPEMTPPAHDSQSAIAEITSPDNVAAALARSEFARSAGNAPNFDLATLAHEVAGAVTVTDQPDPAEHNRSLTIRFSGAVPAGVNASEFATFVVETLAQRYADRHQGRGDEGRLARWQTAADRKRQAQTELDTAQLALREAKTRQSKRFASTQPQRVAAGRNPRWLELHQQLANLKHRRSELLSDVTEHHPELKDYDKHIADVTKQLRATPAWIDLGESGQPAERKDTTAELSDALAKHQHKSQAVISATKLLEAARDKFEEAAAVEQESHRAASTSARLELAWHTPADSHEGVGWRAPRGSTSLALLVALAGGGLAAVCVGKPDFRLRTIGQARRMLSVPVLAVLSRDDSDGPDASPASDSRWARHLRFAAEIVVLGFIAAWIVCLSADSTFASDVARQPLTTLGGSIERVWSIVAR